MILDYPLFRQMIMEIAGKIRGLRIRKINQPDPMEFFLSFGKGLGLLISLKSGLAHLRLEASAEQRQTTPFLLLARKYLEGCKVSSLGIVEGQKIAMLGTSEVSLVIEMPGILNLLVLLDNERKILGTLPYQETTLEDKRVLKKGFGYHEPEPPRFNLFQADALALEKNWGEILSGEDKRWWGLNKLHWSILRQHSRDEALRFFLESRENPSMKPFIAYKGDAVEGISLYPPAKDSRPLEAGRLHEAIAAFFSRESSSSAASENRKRFQSSIKSILEKKKRKLQALTAEYEEAGRSEEWRERGDLILASIGQIQRGDRAFHDPISGRDIPLDPMLGAAENAQACYKKFKKAKNARVMLNREIEKLSKEIESLSELETWVMLAEDPAHWQWLESQLEPFHPQTKKIARKAPAPSRDPFLKTATTDGFALLVGRNAAENVEVLHQARKTDLWFHAKDIPGGHVVIRVENNPVTETAIREAASFAAYYSKGRNWDKVPVDYAERKEIRPVAGGKAHVTYRNFKTVVVSPKITAKERT